MTGQQHDEAVIRVLLPPGCCYWLTVAPTKLLQSDHIKFVIQMVWIGHRVTIYQDIDDLLDELGLRDRLLGIEDRTLPCEDSHSTIVVRMTDRDAAMLFKLNWQD